MSRAVGAVPIQRSLARSGLARRQERNEERQRAYYKEWYQKNRAKLATRRGKETHRARARKAANKAHPKAGPCETCGGKPAYRHHDDYGKPEEIRFLCRSCHGYWHRDNTPQNNKRLGRAVLRQVAARKLAAHLIVEQRRKQKYKAQKKDPKYIAARRAACRKNYWKDIEKSRARGRETAKRLRADNHELTLARERKYRAENREKTNSYSLAWKKRNPEKVREIQRRWQHGHYHANIEESRHLGRERYHNRKKK